MPPPTEPQRRILALLLAEEAAGERPTYREIAAALGWRAVGTVRDHVRVLEREGYVSPPKGRSRGLRLTERGRRAARGRPSPSTRRTAPEAHDASNRRTAPEAHDASSRRTAPEPHDPTLPHMDRLAAEAVEALGPYLERRRYPAGHVLWREGETAGSLVLIERGHVKIHRSQAAGRLVPLYVFGPGDVFGFLPFLDGGDYPAGAVTLEPVQARVVDRAGLLRAVQANPQVAMVLLGALARRLRTAFARIEELSVRGALPRVAAALAALLPEKAGGKLTVVKLPASARTLAEALGLSPETVSRAITQLAQAGVVHRLGARRLQILDVEALRRSARPADW